MGAFSDWIQSHLNSLLGDLSGDAGLVHTWAGIVGGFFLAYAGGLLASLTPCVYPMIPITISVVGGTGGKKRPAFRTLVINATAYVLGMTAVYAFLGVLAGLTGQLFGSFTQSFGWYLGLGILLTLAALSMLDVIPLDPQSIISRLGRLFGSKVHGPSVKKDMSSLAAFGLGASSGVIASPCTTPILAAILGYIAKTQSVGIGLLLMTGFALGIGTLLFAVAIFAGALERLPKSGAWMTRIKWGSGLLLLFFAEYLFYLAGRSQ